MADLAWVTECGGSLGVRPREVKSSMEYKIVAKQFDDATVAHLYAYRHLCVATMNGCVIENRNADGDVVDYSVLELVAVAVMA